MRPLLPLALTLLATLGTAACRHALVIRPQPLEEGARLEGESLAFITAKVDRTVDGERDVVEMSEGERTRWRETWLEVKDGVPVHARLAFELQQQLGPDQRVLDEGALQGRTFFITREGDALTISAELPVPSSDQQTLRSKFSEFGRPNALSEALRGVELTPGGQVPSLAQALRSLFEEGRDEAEGGEDLRSSISVKQSHATFRETREGAAHFELSLQFTQGDDVVELTSDLAGRMVVDVRSGLVLEVSLEGPTRMRTSPEAERVGTVVRGEGRMVLREAQRRLP